MNAHQAGQVTREAAEVYDDLLLPGMMRPWARRLVQIAEVAAGQNVLDVACGTGVLAAEAASRLGDKGVAVGVDSNAGMLAVARRRLPGLGLQRAAAEALPFRTASFDRVLSQFGLMFFDDKPAAVGEMVRVLRPRGVLCVAVWAALELAPAYVQLAALLDRLFGPHAGDSIRLPSSLGRPEQMESLLAVDGLEATRVTLEPGPARFPSLRAWLEVEVKGWVLAEAVDDRQFEHLLREAAVQLRPYVMPDGAVVFEAPAVVAQARRS
jgi:ubiquinone/menaquinone biosynthesis C-methylase UbiE